MASVVNSGAQMLLPPTTAFPDVFNYILYPIPFAAKQPPMPARADGTSSPQAFSTYEDLVLFASKNKEFLRKLEDFELSERSRFAEFVDNVTEFNKWVLGVSSVIMQLCEARKNEELKKVEKEWRAKYERAVEENLEKSRIIASLQRNQRLGVGQGGNMVHAMRSNEWEAVVGCERLWKEQGYMEDSRPDGTVEDMKNDYQGVDEAGKASRGYPATAGPVQVEGNQKRWWGEQCIERGETKKPLHPKEGLLPRVDEAYRNDYQRDCSWKEMGGLYEAAQNKMETKGDRASRESYSKNTSQFKKASNSFRKAWRVRSFGQENLRDAVTISSRIGDNAIATENERHLTVRSEGLSDGGSTLLGLDTLQLSAREGNSEEGRKRKYTEPTKTAGLKRARGEGQHEDDTQNILGDDASGEFGRRRVLSHPHDENAYHDFTQTLGNFDFEAAQRPTHFAQ